MTFYDKLWNIASSAKETTSGILFESMKEPLRPYIVEEMNKMAAELKYDGWKYDRPAFEYPEAMYQFMWEPVRKATLRFLQETHPKAWFLPLYLTKEEQKELGLPV